MDKIALTAVLKLQDALCDEIEEITKDMPFKRYGKPGNGYRIKAYPQDLPIPQKNSENAGNEFMDENADEIGVFNFPWAIVKLDSGSTSAPAPQSYMRTDLIVAVGVYDDNHDRSGYRGVITAITRIMERFQKQPLLAGKFTCIPIDKDEMFSWGLQDEDTHPYYYGALKMAFLMQSFEREDKYA